MQIRWNKKTLTLTDKPVRWSEHEVYAFVTDEQGQEYRATWDKAGFRLGKPKDVVAVQY